MRLALYSFFQGTRSNLNSIFLPFSFLKHTSTNTIRSIPLPTQSGDIWNMNLPALTPDLLKRKRFCGLPNGIRSDPRMAAMFSIEMIGRMHSSLLTLLKRRIVSGTKMMSDTSLVTNIEVKNTPNMRKSERLAIVENPELSLRRGRNRSSCLKPSRTVSIMKSIPRVCQSMAKIRFLDGGVMKSDMTAARSDTGSIGSFLISNSNFFIGEIVSQIYVLSIGKSVRFSHIKPCHIVFKTI